MLSKKFFKDLELFIDRHINCLKLSEPKSIVYEEMNICENIAPHELESFIENNKTPSFKEILFAFIDSKSLNDSEVYKKANIDRRHFSKIRSNPDYHPSKRTVIALSLALSLDEEDTYELLNSAGYSLSDSDTFDLVIQYCLNKNVYDIYDVNMALDYFSLKSL